MFIRYPHARPEVTQDILARGLDLCPELVSPDYRPGTSPQPTVEDLKPLVLEEICGLRPARKGGIRLEAELLRSTARQDQPSVEVPVVHNYGYVSGSTVENGYELNHKFFWPPITGMAVLATSPHGAAPPWRLLSSRINYLRSNIPLNCNNILENESF